MSEPYAVEVIAETLSEHRAVLDGQCCKCGVGILHGKPLLTTHACHAATEVLAALKAAGFVVATRDEIRAMSVQEQAELIGGTVRAYRARRIYEKPPLNGYDGSHMHVVGPWREVQP